MALPSLDSDTGCPVQMEELSASVPVYRTMNAAE